MRCFLLKCHAYVNLHVQCLLFLPDFKQNPHVPTNVSKNLKYGTSRKHLKWQSRCSMRKDGRKDRTRLVDVIRFAIASTYIYDKVRSMKDLLVLYEVR